jgi:hypothetical protein
MVSFFLIVSVFEYGQFMSSLEKCHVGTIVLWSVPRTDMSENYVTKLVHPINLIIDEASYSVWCSSAAAMFMLLF